MKVAWTSEMSVSNQIATQRHNSEELESSQSWKPQICHLGRQISGVNSRSSGLWHCSFVV